MNIFVSYSFRAENDWIERYVIPLIECFGHEVQTGKILDSGGLDEEIKRKIKQCQRVLCFTTRAKPNYDMQGVVTDYQPPDWVRDELMMSRGGEQNAIEFREQGVNYGGAAVLRPYVLFDREQIPQLLVDLARRVSEWPVGPLQLKLSVPDALRSDFEQAANARTLRARCEAIDLYGGASRKEELDVYMRDGQLIVPFWIKPDPNLSIEIEVNLGARRLAARGISPSVREARLTPF